MSNWFDDVRKDMGPRARIMVVNGGNVLVVKERDGFWGLPGGHIDARESPRDAAMREAHEELGISVELLNNKLPQHGMKRSAPMPTEVFLLDLDQPGIQAANVIADMMPSEEIVDFKWEGLPFTDSAGNVYRIDPSVERKNAAPDAKAAIAMSIQALSDKLSAMDEGEDQGARMAEMRQEAQNLGLLLDDMSASAHKNANPKGDIAEIGRHVEGIEHELGEMEPEFARDNASESELARAWELHGKDMLGFLGLGDKAVVDVSGARYGKLKPYSEQPSEVKRIWKTSYEDAHGRRNSEAREHGNAGQHLAICPAGCQEAHDFCRIPNCGKVGKHLASDHIPNREALTPLAAKSKGREHGNAAKPEVREMGRDDFSIYHNGMELRQGLHASEVPGALDEVKQELQSIAKGADRQNMSDAYEFIKRNLHMFKNFSFERAQSKLEAAGFPSEKAHNAMSRACREGLVGPEQTVFGMDRKNHIVKEGEHDFRLLSHKGKNLGDFPSHAKAAKHEGEVQWFKEHKNGVNDDLKRKVVDGWKNGKSIADMEKELGVKIKTKTRSLATLSQELLSGDFDVSRTNGEDGRSQIEDPAMCNCGHDFEHHNSSDLDPCSAMSGGKECKCSAFRIGTPKGGGEQPVSDVVY